MKNLRIAAEIVGIFGALVAELLLHALLGGAMHIPGKYDDERIN